MVKKILNWFGSLRGKSYESSMIQWLQGNDMSSNSANLNNAFEQCSWVYAACQAIASKVANIPLKSYSIGNAENEQASQQILYGRQDKYDLIERICLNLLLSGEAPLTASKDGMLLRCDERGEKIIECQRPSLLEPVKEDGKLTGWKLSAEDGSGYILVLPEELQMLKLTNPTDKYRGLSPLTAAKNAAQSDYTSGVFMRGLLETNADAGLVVTSKQNLSHSQQEQITAALNERKNRLGRNNKPLFLVGGVDVQKAQISTVDLQFLENRKFTRQEILAIYRVPETVLGYSEDSNRSNTESQILQWINNVIMPMCRRIEAGLDQFTRNERKIWQFDIEELPELQAARRSRVDGAAKLFSMGVPLEEVNRIMDLGLKEQAWSKAGFIPANMVEIGKEKTDAKQNINAGNPGRSDGV